AGDAAAELLQPPPAPRPAPEALAQEGVEPLAGERQHCEPHEKGEPPLEDRQEPADHTQRDQGPADDDQGDAGSQAEARKWTARRLTASSRHGPVSYHGALVGPARGVDKQDLQSPESPST